MRLFYAAMCGLAVAAAASSAAARPFRVNDIPNGTKNTCLNCHIDLKASAQTDFGSDATANLIGPSPVSSKHVDWAPLCPLDSDHDGYSNGVELGDPNCTWKMGDPNPMGSVFNPGDPDSHPPPVCGNGKLDAGESCEGSMMSETDCAILAYGEGQLGCNADCTFNYSGCSDPPEGLPDPEGGSGDDIATDGSGCSAAPSRPNRDGAPHAGAALFLPLALALALAARRRAL